MLQGDSSGVCPKMDFRSAVGSKPSLQGSKVFDNNLFSVEPEKAMSRSAGGLRIPKINGCLERCAERPNVVIPMEMLAEDIDYFSRHSLYCKFLGLKISLQFLDSWAQRTWLPEGEMEIHLLEIIISWSLSTAWRIGIGFLKGARIFTTRWACSLSHGMLVSIRQRNFQIRFQCGFVFQGSLWNVGARMCCTY